MSDLAVALMVAIHVHAKQMDDHNEPYLLHILRVVESVRDESKIVAALHDVSEYKGFWYLLQDHERYALNLLTRKDEYYSEYINNIRESRNPIAIEVKIADLEDKLAHIPPELKTKKNYEDGIRYTKCINFLKL